MFHLLKQNRNPNPRYLSVNYTRRFFSWEAWVFCVALLDEVSAVWFLVTEPLLPLVFCALPEISEAGEP